MKNFLSGNAMALGLLFLLVIVSLGISTMCMTAEYFEGKQKDTPQQSIMKDRVQTTGGAFQGIPLEAPVVRPSPADTKNLSRNMPALEAVPSMMVENGLKTDSQGAVKEGVNLAGVQATSSFETWDGPTPMTLDKGSGEPVLPKGDTNMRFVNSDLLPKSDPKFDDSFAELAPDSLKGQSFLDPARHMISTPPLRNSNFQLRSETANPVREKDVQSGWNLSTIQPDVMRRPLEIGTKAVVA